MIGTEVVSLERKRGCFSGLFRFVLVLAVLAGFWWFENRTIVTDEYTLASERLPEGFDGFRIVELSDLHGVEFGKENETLLEGVRAARPDLIALDGDLADERTDLAVIRRLAPRLCEIAPVYYVTGNHEWAMGNRKALFSILEEAGVVRLENEYRLLERDGQSIALAGIDDPNGPWDKKSPETLVTELRAARGDSYALLLAHRNDELSRWAALGFDAVLCGHAHGGIIRIPGVGGLLGTGMQLFPDYDAGLYREGRTAMVVSRGLGDSSVPFRLFNRPEIAVIILKTVNNS